MWLDGRFLVSFFISFALNVGAFVSHEGVYILADLPLILGTRPSHTCPQVMAKTKYVTPLFFYPAVLVGV